MSNQFLNLGVEKSPQWPRRLRLHSPSLCFQRGTSGCHWRPH